MVSYLKSSTAISHIQSNAFAIARKLLFETTGSQLHLGFISIVAGAVFLRISIKQLAAQDVNVSHRKITVVCFAICFISLGIIYTSLVCVDIWNTLHHQKGAHPLYYPPLLSEEKKLAIEISQKLQECSPAKEVWDHVEREGCFAVRICNNSEMPTFADWNPRTRTIRLWNSIPSNSKLSGLLFELCNAQLTKTYLGIERQLHQGMLKLGDYAEITVKTEWYAMQCHSVVAQRCIRSHAWDPTIDEFGEVLKKFPDPNLFWIHYKQDPTYERHQQHFISMWNEHGKKSYCKRNPDSTLC